MQPRALLVALLFVAMPLAGCLGGSTEDEPLTDASTDDGFNQDSPEGRRLLAFEETNATEEGVGGVDHHHDYWAGRERVEIFSVPAHMDPSVSGNGAVATFRPPQGTFVYEATERLEFTLSEPTRRACNPTFTLGGHFVCYDNLDFHTGVDAAKIERIADPTGGPDGLTLRYKHAATVEWIEVGTISWGEPTIIRITNPIQTDMPHATSSVWEFQVISPHPQDATLAFTATAEIVRGGADIPLWPGHPNFYVDSTERKVLSTDWGACDNGFGASACLTAGEKTGPIHADRLVSYGTRTVFVWINITETNFPNPATQPVNWFLFHRNATGQDNVTNVFDEENHPVEKMEHLWVLPVDDDGMDSPYADGSRWNFELGAAFKTPHTGVYQLSCYGGCAEWSAKYTIDVISTNYSLPWAEYDWACLREDYCPSEDDAADPEGRYTMGTYVHPDGRKEEVRIRTG